MMTIRFITIEKFIHANLTHLDGSLISDNGSLNYIESRVFIDASMIMSVHIFVSEHLNVHICVALCVCVCTCVQVYGMLCPCEYVFVYLCFMFVRIQYASEQVDMASVHCICVCGCVW